MLRSYTFRLYMNPMKSLIKRIEKKPGLQVMVSLLALIAALIFAAHSRFPVEIRSLAVAARYSFVTTSIGLLCIFYLILRLPPRWRMPLVFLGCGSLFGLALAGLWASGQSEPYVVSGLIPYNDAATYYIDANRLLDGSLLSDSSSRRPLAIGVLASLLGITGRSLQYALTILVLLEAIAAAYMTLEVRRVKGPAAAALVLWITFLFARRFIGTTMTETLGLTFGMLSMTFFLRGASENRLTDALLGAFLLTLAMNIRVGALFLLPLILLWVGIHFRGTTRFSWKNAFFAGLVVVAGFGLNSIVLYFVGSPLGMAFGNFSESLYGLASGGERWSYVYSVNEETNYLPDRERFALIYRLAFDLIRENPMGIVKGSLHQWGLLFSDTWFSVYSYVGGENVEGNRYIHWGLYALCFVALINVVRKRCDPLLFFILFSTFGILISVPFVPPGDAHKMRAYAATIPLLAFLPAYGLSELVNLIPLTNLKDQPDRVVSADGLAIFSGILTTFMVLAPVVFMKAAIPPKVEIPLCQPGEIPVSMHYEPGNEVRLIRENVIQLDWLPEFHFGRYKIFIHNLPNNEAIAILERLEPPATLLLGYDIHTDKRIWLLTDTQKMPDSHGILQICGNFYESDDPNITRYGFFFPREIQIQP